MTALILSLFLRASAPDGGVVPAPGKHAPPRPAADGRARITELLKRPKKPTTAELKSVDPTADVVLAAIASDPAESANARVRAIDVWIELGPGAEALSTLKPLLDDPVPAVRIAASDALGHLGTPDAREALQNRLDAETDASVRTALERALARVVP